MDNHIPNILKDIVFDGTFYHLWYLPSSMLGAVIAWYLIKKLNYKKALAAASVQKRPPDTFIAHLATKDLRHRILRLLLSDVCGSHVAAPLRFTAS